MSEPKLERTCHCNIGDACDVPWHWRAIEVPPDPSVSYDFRVEDTDGNLWGLTQRLKRIDDELSAYGLGACLIDLKTGKRVVLAHFITLVDEPQDGNDGPAEQSGEPESNCGPGGTCSRCR